MTIPDLRTLLPHSGRMVLLDRVVAVDPDVLTAEVTVRADSLFLEEGGVGAWVGLEYMAQAAAALAGSLSRQEGGGVRQGVLLGTRRYECDRAVFPLGCRLQVTARRTGPADGELSQYECRIEGDSIHAAATVTIFHGAGIDTLLAGEDA